MRRRQLLIGMSATRAHHVRAWLRAHPGQLGPNPDQLVLALLGVIALVAVAVTMISFLGLA